MGEWPKGAHRLPSTATSSTQASPPGAAAPSRTYSLTLPASADVGPCRSLLCLSRLRRRVRCALGASRFCRPEAVCPDGVPSTSAQALDEGLCEFHDVFALGGEQANTSGLRKEGTRSPAAHAHAGAAARQRAPPESRLPVEPAVACSPDSLNTQLIVTSASENLSLQHSDTVKFGDSLPRSFLVQVKVMRVNVDRTGLQVAECRAKIPYDNQRLSAFWSSSSPPCLNAISSSTIS